MNHYHYVYRLDAPDGAFYYGSRSSRVHPQKDKYMGSGVWPTQCRKSGIKLKKTVVMAEFESRKKASEFELDLILSEKSNSLLRNRNASIFTLQLIRKPSRGGWEMVLLNPEKYSPEHLIIAREKKLKYVR